MFLSGIILKSNYGLLINGVWKDKDLKKEVLNKYSRETVARTSISEKADVDNAINAAKQSLEESFNPYKRYEVLKTTSEKLIENKHEIAKVLALEVGKPIHEARGEVERAALTMEISAEEAKRITGEGIPIESAEGSENRQAWTVRVPVGVVAAITPFNVPLNLVCHKVGPAIAAGNSVVLKPAEATPLSALILAEILDDAGLPKGRLNLVTGKGSEIGKWLTLNNDVDLFTFTGSPEVGQQIVENAGIRKVLLELGNNSATIIHKDADVESCVKQVGQKSFNNAGQVCISVQRVYLHEMIYDEFLAKLKRFTNDLVIGNPLNTDTDIGPMIDEKEAIRVEEWVKDAQNQGAIVETGGKRDEVFFQPTVLSNVRNDMKVCREEIFGPVVAVDKYSDQDEVISKVNDSQYGLQAGLFTNDLGFVMKAAKEIEVGGLIVNDTAGYRVDHMPYGGIKNSGSGKEGPKYAIEEMTEEKLVVFNL